MKNPEHNTNLDHLFNKAKADEQGLDDFEKEAMSGFDLLDSEQEAHDLKAALDTRIHKELFKKEEKNNPKIYWLAAAGLALVIGLSTLFIINNNDSINNNNVAAAELTGKNKEEILPDSKKQLNDEVAATPAESVLKESAVTNNSSVNEVAEAEEKPNQEAFKQEATKGVKKDEMTSRMIVPAVKTVQGPKDDLALEKNKAEQKDGEIVLGNTSKNSSVVNNFDGLGKNDKSKDTERENKDYQFASTTTAGTKADQNAKVAEEESEKTVTDKLASDEPKKKGKKAEDNRSNDSDKDLKQPVAITTHQNEIAINTEGKSTSKRAKNSAAKQNNSTASDGVYKGQPGGGIAKTETTTYSAGEVNAVPVEVPARKEDFINCYYIGGEPVITKDLKEKLSAQNLDKKFDATVYVNEIKAVEKVEFTNAYDLTAKQKEDITKILKTLNKFNFFMSPTTKGTHPYKILYRP